MKTFLLSFIMICFSFISVSQEMTEAELLEIIESYKSKMNQFTTYEGCGHVLDGPAYVGKQFENTTLDAMLFITEGQEKELGVQFYENIKKENKIIEDHLNKTDINEILKKIIKTAERTNINYTINVIESEELNAFTTLGGYIFLTTGLLDVVDSYDELAFIIAHEVAHADRLHLSRKILKLAISSTLFGFAGYEDFKKIALNISAMMSAPFDQIDEYEADKFGVAMAKKAGYDTKRFTDFFVRLEKYQNKNLINKLLSTHPFAEHRKNCINEYIKE